MHRSFSYHFNQVCVGKGVNYIVNCNWNSKPQMMRQENATRRYPNITLARQYRPRSLVLTNSLILLPIIILDQFQLRRDKKGLLPDWCFLNDPSSGRRENRKGPTSCLVLPRSSLPGPWWNMEGQAPFLPARLGREGTVQITYLPDWE